MTCFPVKKKDERRMIYGRSFLINNHPLVFAQSAVRVRLYDFFGKGVIFQFAFSIWGNFCAGLFFFENEVDTKLNIQSKNIDISKHISFSY